METRCHLGEVIRYDTVGELGWGVSLRTHPIEVVMHQVLGIDWQEEGSTTAVVPKPKKAVDVEGEDGVCSVSVLALILFCVLMGHSRRIASIGNSETSRIIRSGSGDTSNRLP